MNTTTIATDGVCVFMHTKVRHKAAKILFRISQISIITGIVILSTTNNVTLQMLGGILLIGGIILTVPLLRTILWNIAGEEIISFSTKSAKIERCFGFIKPKPKTYLYDRRLKFRFEVLKEENNVQEGVIHFYSYDSNNQPYHLCQTTAYIKKEECKEFINKLQLVFALDKDIQTEYSAN